MLGSRRTLVVGGTDVWNRVMKSATVIGALLGILCGLGIGAPTSVQAQCYTPGAYHFQMRCVSGPDTMPTHGQYTQVYIVKNTSGGGLEFGFDLTCTNLSSCSTTTNNIDVAAGDSIFVPVTYTTSSTTGTQYPKLTVHSLVWPNQEDSWVQWGTPVRDRTVVTPGGALLPYQPGVMGSAATYSHSTVKFPQFDGHRG